MLFDALNFIVDEFNAYRLRLDRNAAELVLGNIALQDGQVGTGSQPIDDSLVLSLINIEEERTLKNEPNFRKAETGPVNQNPPLYLNLYLLFSANLDDYAEALRFLSLILQFFQQHKSFTSAKYPILGESNIERMNFEIFDLSFEQTNNLWGILGSKLLPSILYKVRTVSIQASPEVGAGIVREIVVNDNTIITD